MRHDLDTAIPDLDALLAAVMGAATHTQSVYHGPQHWQAVGRVGATLIERGAPGDPAVVFLFALLHDTKRLNDDDDPDHGPRAAAFARELHAAGHFHLAPAQLDELVDAIASHTSSGAAPGTLRGVCFDADRLNLARVGITPDPHYLSSGPVLVDPDFIADCSARCHEPTPWPDLFDRYRELAFAQLAPSLPASRQRPARPARPATRDARPGR